MNEDKVEVYRGEDGDWYWRRVAPNGEQVSRGEGYTRTHDAVEGAARATGFDIADIRIVRVTAPGET